MTESIYVHKPKTLLHDRAAGDAVAGTAGGIGFHVVSFGVDDDGSATIGENRIAARKFVGNIFVHELEMGLAFGVCGEVLHVAGVMAFGILQAVLLACRIEMRAGGFKVRRFTLGILVNMDRVLARRQVVESQVEADASLAARYNAGADDLAFRIFEFDLGFGGAGKRG